MKYGIHFPCYADNTFFEENWPQLSLGSPKVFFSIQSPDGVLVATVALLLVCLVGDI